jgi:hypothetical protein
MTAPVPSALPVLVETELPDRERPELGPRLDLYTLEEPLGEGALARVWRARDRRTGSAVALKQVHSRRTAEAWRLKNEYRALRRIWSPHVVAPRELVQSGDGGPAFFTMQCVEGRSPVRCLAADRSSPAFARRFLALARQLVAAVRAVHHAGLVHRDIKPDNILVDARDRLVLVDFDLAVHQEWGPHGAGRIAGSPSTSAPEVDQGMGASTASDWFSVGATLWTMLLGRAPFSGSARRILLRKRSGRPDLPDVLPEGIPEEIEAVLRGLLSPRRRDRPRPSAVAAAFGLPPARPVPVPSLESTGPVLEAINRAVRTGGARVLRIDGPASLLPELGLQACQGIGRDQGVLLLHGSCGPGERVPMKLLDELVDQLAGVLRSLPSAQLRRLLPRDLSPLLQVFPAFQSIGCLRELGRPVRRPPDSRGRALDGLREVLGRLSVHRRLIVWLDHIEEADVESCLALDRLLGTAAPELLWVMTAADTARRPVLASIDRLLDRRMAGRTERLHLAAPRRRRAG